MPVDLTSGPAIAQDARFMTRAERLGFLSGATATTVVGASFAASAAITGYPFAAGQAARYLLAAVVLTAIAGGALGRPTGRDLVLLAGVSLFGQLLFNLAMLAAVEEAAPSTVGVIVGCTPLVLALAGPLARRERPSPPLLTAAALVVAGAAITEGLGHGSLAGLLLAAAALACEVLFTLLGAPVVARLGALRVSAWTCWFGALMCAALAVVTAAPRMPDGAELAALLYLALPVTVGGFVCWYRAVDALSVERAGLLVGLMPISAYVGALVLGAEPAALAPAIGALLVGAGIIAGLRAPVARDRADQRLGEPREAVGGVGLGV